MHKTTTIKNIISNPIPQVKNAANGEGTPDFEVGYGVADRDGSDNESSGSKNTIIFNN